MQIPRSGARYNARTKSDSRARARERERENERANDAPEKCPLLFNVRNPDLYLHKVLALLFDRLILPLFEQHTRLIFLIQTDQQGTNETALPTVRTTVRRRKVKLGRHHARRLFPFPGGIGTHSSFVR
jgi:hypothetical protein